MISWVDLFKFEAKSRRCMFNELKEPFREYGLSIGSLEIPVFESQFWTSKQRQASSIHEISYRACFKPQVPSFFIRLLTEPGCRVYDPFSGRGTTVIEAALQGRRVVSNDINPLSILLVSPRFMPPDETKLVERLCSIAIDPKTKSDVDLSMFYHPKTFSEILSIRNYLLERTAIGREDSVDSWIRMVSTNRLTGHSKGFFSVYTLPPNQAVSPESQIKINQRLKQSPQYKDTKEIIRRKTRSLLRTLTMQDRQNLEESFSTARFLCSEADQTLEIENDSVDLVITSPPFLDVVQYARDNWLRCWFNNIDTGLVSKEIAVLKSLPAWRKKMETVFSELFRVTRPGSWIAFEVGEVRKNTIKLDEIVAPAGISAGFDCRGVLINSQRFTKTANIWGVNNNKAGTNTNRIVMFQKGF